MADKRIQAGLDLDNEPILRKIKEVEQEFQRLEAQIVRFGQSTFHAGGQGAFQNAGEVKNLYGKRSNPADNLPALDSMLKRFDDLGKQLGGLRFFAGNPGATPQSLLAQAKATPSRDEASRITDLARTIEGITKDLISADKALLASRREEMVFNSQRNRLARSVVSSRTLSEMGSLATGNAGPLVRNIASGVLQMMTSGTVQGGGIFQSGMAALRLARGAPAVAAADGAAVPAAAGGAEGLVGLLTGPVGLALAAVAAGVAVDQFVNKAATSAQVTGYQLRANIGGIDTSRQALDTEGLLDGRQGLGLRYGYDQATTNGIATQLGSGGVQVGDLKDAMKNTFSLARAGAMDPNEIAPLTATLMNQGGRSNAEIARMYQEMIKQAKETHVPLSRLINDMKEMGGVSTTAFGVNGLASVQSIVGKSMDAGSLMSGAANATGASAVSMAALIAGGNVDKFMGMQKNPAQMWDAIAAFVQHLPGAQGAKTSSQTKEIMADILSNSGLMGMAGVAPQNVMGTLNKLLTQGPGAAAKMAQGLSNAEAIDPAKAWRDSMIGAAKQQVTDLDNLKLLKDAVLNDFGRQHADLMDIYGSTKQIAINTTPPEVAGKPNTGSGGIVKGPGGMPVLLEPTSPSSLVDNIVIGALKALGIMNDNSPSAAGIPSGISTSGQYGVHPVKNSQLSTSYQLGTVLAKNFGGEQMPVPASMLPYFEAATNNKSINKAGVPLSVLLTMAAQESGFHANANNGSHYGIGQFDSDAISTITGTKDSPFYHKKFDPMNASQAIPAMEWFLNYKIQIAKGNMAAGIANYGEGPAYAASTLKEAQQVEVVVNGTLKIADTNGNPAGTVAIHKQHSTHKPAPVSSTHGPGSGHSTQPPKHGSTPPPPHRGHGNR